MINVNLERLANGPESKLLEGVLLIMSFMVRKPGGNESGLARDDRRRKTYTNKPALPSISLLESIPEWLARFKILLAFPNV